MRKCVVKYGMGWMISVLCLIYVNAFISLAADPPAEPASPLYVFLLADGCRLIGEPQVKALPFSSSIGKVAIPFEKIEKLSFNRKDNSAKALMKNGDELQGTVDLKTIRVATCFGKCEIVLTNIVQITAGGTVRVQIEDTPAKRNGCINNLRQLEAGKDQYALEQGLTNGSLISFGNIGPGATGGAYIKRWPVCPAGTNAGASVRSRSRGMAESDYVINPVGSNAACRIHPSTHFLR